MENKHKKRYQTSLATSKMQIKTTVSYPYTPIRMAKLEIVTIPNVSKYAENQITYSWQVRI